MARGRSHLIEIHRGVLVGELTTSVDTMMEEIDPWSHAVRRYALG